MPSHPDNILLQKLDEFIRKYYKNLLLRGALYASGILLGAFLSVVLLEYFGEFNTVVRAVLFFGFLGATGFVLIRYIAIPLLKLNRIGPVISYDQAAKIIGSHFSAVQDKLINVLQLQNNRIFAGSDELLLAGIRQKTEELRPVPFTTAVDLRENRRYLKYLLPLILIAVGILVIRPQIIKKSTERLVNYNVYYEKEMPFRFTIRNTELKAVQSQDYRLDIKITGDELPADAFISIGGIEYRLEKENNNLFHYTFTNPQSDIKFRLGAAGYLTHDHVLTVLPKPSLRQFNLQIVYPAYLNRPSENLANTGDLQIPQGAKVSWVFNTTNTDEIALRFLDSTATPQRRATNQFGFSRRFMQNNNYTIRTMNKFVAGGDSVSYSINVLADQFPSIEMSAKPDSLNPRHIFFSGQVRDDHGFSRLTFHFIRSGIDSLGRPAETKGSQVLSIARDQVSQSWFHFLDVSPFNLQPGDKLDYYFEVFDNDGVNGPKPSKTSTMSFKAPTRDEINQTTDKNNAEIRKDLEQSIKSARQLQKDVNELAKKINDKKQLGYEEKKKAEDLIKKQQELQNKIEQIRQENAQNNQQQNEFSQTEESILEKQKQLEQLFENVMTPEMKKLFDELNKMLERMDKKQVQEKLEELKLSNKDIEKELNRNLEAFKQLEVQQKMQNAIDKLDELQKKEEALNRETDGKKDDEKTLEKKDDNKSNEKKDAKSEDKKDGNKNDPEKSKDDNSEKKTDKASEQKNDPKNQPDAKKDDKKADPKELSKKQEEIRQEFEQLKKDLQELEQKNKELEEPNALPKTEEKQQQISDEMQKSSEQLNQKNKKAASKSQQSASEKMEEMKEQMEQAMADSEEQQQEENAQTLRQILENLVNLSFSQEELIRELPKTRVDNPQYVEIPKQQNKLRDDSKIIEDSLLALSKRAPNISALINREISAINMNMDKTVKSLAERNTGESAMRMQTTMTSVNNLALLLNESLEQMQNQMKQQSKSKAQKSGKCKKPGQGNGKRQSEGKPSIPNMRKLQEQLNKQLQDMKDALEKGQKPGEKQGDKKGQKPGGGMGGQHGSGLTPTPGNSEQFARMAAQQEALRRQIQELMSKLKNKGKNPGGDISEMMEETEKDLVNKQISNETMRRQQQILSRLLESEKAEQEREQDEQRKSNEAKNENLSNPPQFLEYKRVKEKEMELLNTVPPDLTPYYKEKVNNYFNSINK